MMEKITVYKLFKVDKHGRLHPLFVNAKQALPLNEWLYAETGAAGKDEKHVKSTIGDLSLRPGWHSTMVPFSDWLGKKDTDGALLQRKNTVWCLCEVMGEELTVKEKNGLPYVPNGFYRFKTNSKQKDPWIISDKIRIIRPLTDNEVIHECSKHGLTAQRKED